MLKLFDDGVFVLNLAIWLQATSQVSGQKTALYFGKDADQTYADLAGSVARLAAWFIQIGLKHGDRVAIFMKNRPEYLRLLFGIWHAGGVVVPVNEKLHPKEAAWIFRDAAVSFAFVETALEEALKAVIEKCTSLTLIPVSDMGFTPTLTGDVVLPAASRQPDDLAWLFYTSGTTGHPKGVLITHGMLSAMTLCYLIDVDDVFSQDVAIYAAPMSHGAGLYSLIHVLKGAGHVYPRSGGFDPLEIFDLAEYFGSAHMFAAPTMVKRLSTAAKLLSHTPTGLRTIVYGGGPMYVVDIIDAVEVFGDIFVQIYGQGECPMAISVLSRRDVSDRSHPLWRERLASVGRPQSFVEVQIGDKTANPLAISQIGEVQVRGQPVMSGYWNNPQANEKVFINGWLMTGDMGVMDESGYITLKDRSKDMIISGGSNIYPREVEEALLTHSDVAEVAVIGRAHPDWGEEVVAFVVAKAGYVLSGEILDGHCLDHLARFKRPKKYITLAELPKNNYGKVLKTELRKWLKSE